jgi:hypothetical protein
MQVALFETSKTLIVKNLAPQTLIRVPDQRKASKTEGGN